MNRTATLHERKEREDGRVGFGFLSVVWGFFSFQGFFLFVCFNTSSLVSKTKNFGEHELSQSDCRMLPLSFQPLLTSLLDIQTFKSCQGSFK